MISCASGAGSNKELIEKRKEERGLAGAICKTERKNPPVDGTERKERGFPREDGFLSISQ
jgi:hypothetical protein